MSAFAEWTGERFAHEAFVFDTDEQARDRVVPFVVEGLELGQPVIAVLGAGTIDVVRHALGRDVDRLLLFEESERWWRGDAYRTLAAYAALMAPLVEAGRPWRLAGQPVWVGADGGHWSRLESACNESFASLPYYSLCLHDRRRLHARALEHVGRTHPTAWCDGVAEEPAYQPPRDYLRSVEAAWDEPSEPVASGDVVSPAAARAAMAPVAALTDDAQAVLLAVSELATNALVVAPSCRVRAWTTGGDLVVEVADDGPGFDAGIAGYVPPLPSQAQGRGLWMVRQLARDLGVRSGPWGTVARARFGLG